MKKLIIILVCLVFLCSLIGCAEEGKIIYLTSLNTSSIMDTKPEIEISTSIDTKSPEKQTTAKTENTQPAKSSDSTTNYITTSKTDYITTSDSITTETAEVTVPVETEPDEPDNIIVYWLEKGSVYHLSLNCSYLKDKNNILSRKLKECPIEKVCSRCSKNYG